MSLIGTDNSATREGSFSSSVALGSSRLGASGHVASEINFRFYSYRCRPWWRDTRQSEKIISIAGPKVAIAVLILFFGPLSFLKIPVQDCHRRSCGTFSGR